MYEEEKHLNYKKVILVVAIIILVISCIYIGIILPQLVNSNKENPNTIIDENQISEGSTRDKENIVKVELTPNVEPPSREEEKQNRF